MSAFAGRQMTACTGDADGVTAELSTGDSVRARYLVGCDGGPKRHPSPDGCVLRRDDVSDRWLVIDVANDPPPPEQRGRRRPAAALRLDLDRHTVSGASSSRSTPTNPTSRPPIPRSSPNCCRASCPIRRRRTSSGTGGVHPPLAHRRRFRKGRLMIAGDAAHLMPVWQGRGYNSGIRDAFNLGWKLAAVVNGQAGDSLLDTYDVERRKHARAMIDLSTMAGRVISPTNRRALRACGTSDPGRVGRADAEELMLEMRFKPMPRYEHGAVVHAQTPPAPGSVVGTCSSSPVDTREQAECPARRRHRARVRGAVLEQRSAPAARRCRVRPLESPWALSSSRCGPRPSCTGDAQGGPDPDVTVVGDRTGALKVLRHPDRLRAVPSARPVRCRRLHRTTRTGVERRPRACARAQYGRR